MMGQNKKKVDIHTTKSEKTGFRGLIEVFLRKFNNLAFMALLAPIAVLGLSLIGLSCFPAVVLVKYLNEITADANWYVNALAIGLGIGFGYFIYGITLIFLVPLVNFLLPLRVKPWRGNWYSTQTIPWYIHNSLVYIVRYTFLDMVTPTPFNVLFYRMMGMKIGKGVAINTTNISDPCLITLEDYVTLGGSATIVAHYGQKGFLILAPVVIKKGATIGLKATVMGDVEIGEGATVKPHSAVLPKSRIGPGELV